MRWACLDQHRDEIQTKNLRMILFYDPISASYIFFLKRETNLYVNKNNVVRLPWWSSG